MRSRDARELSRGGRLREFARGALRRAAGHLRRAAGALETLRARLPGRTGVPEYGHPRGTVVGARRRTGARVAPGPARTGAAAPGAGGAAGPRSRGGSVPGHGARADAGDQCGRAGPRRAGDRARGTGRRGAAPRAPIGDRSHRVPGHPVRHPRGYPVMVDGSTVDPSTFEVDPSTVPATRPTPGQPDRPQGHGARGKGNLDTAGAGASQ